MAMKITQWEFSDDIVNDTQVPEGLRAIKIEDAYYNDEDFTYHLECTDIQTGTEFRLQYWMYSRDPKTQELTKVKTTIGTLNSLGRAIFGDDAQVGVPAPCDIIGAVCIANITLKESPSSGRKYPRCYNYMSAYESEKWASDIEQYFRPVE